MTVDKKDELILEELVKDARKPTKHIALDIDIPRVTVHTRIEKLKERGVIKRFTIQKDYKKIGLPVMAYVFISFTPDHQIAQRDLAKKIAGIPNVYEVHLISGEWDIIVKIRGETLDQIGKIILDEIRTIKGVSKTITCPCFSTIKDTL
jgi:DNA-binding Lrp family transcriptional regulator